MIQKWNVTIPALTGDEARGVYLYLPADYDWSPERHYPVLYMFDGHNVFFDSHATYGKSWGMKEYMERSGAPLIIAAVECNQPGSWASQRIFPVQLPGSLFWFDYRPRRDNHGLADTYV